MSLDRRILHLEQRMSPKKRKAVRFVESEAEITDDPDVCCWIVGIPEGHFQKGNDIVRSDDSEPTEKS